LNAAYSGLGANRGVAEKAGGSTMPVSNERLGCVGGIAGMGNPPLCGYRLKSCTLFIYETPKNYPKIKARTL
jgi:hypothetical protein